MVADRIGGCREGRGSPEGFSTMGGISEEERTSASQSRDHRRGLSGWGGSTRQRSAWGGVETVGGGLEWDVHGGLGRPERKDGGSPDTRSPASAYEP
jgi:hypothetical protein